MHKTIWSMHIDSRIIYRNILGTANDAERKALGQWLEADPSHRELYQELARPDALEREWRRRSVVDWRRPARDMAMRLGGERRRSAMGRAMRAAAAIALAVALGATLYYTVPSLRLAPGPDDTVVAATGTEAEAGGNGFLQPGTLKATVTDGSGRTAALDSAGAGGMLAQAVAPVPGATLPPVPVLKPRQLNLEVPRGGEYHIMLEDSTEVWLNAQSTLSYPDMFGPRERRVAVTGEAYFKVKPDRDRPFYVETRGQVIRVWGTAFNVRDYIDEPCTCTTLESGSISLRSSTAAAAGELFMSRGHQAVYDNGSRRVAMTVVDPATVTSWRLGRFVFEDQPLGRIMRDLSRWYDFDYEFTDPTLEGRVFMGSIERYAHFATVMEILQNCGGITFAVETGDTAGGGVPKVTVSPTAN